MSDAAPPSPRGVRFAPSPTGRFHVGNLRTAWVSHRIARALSEPWIVRFEDIDRARALPWAQASQLEDMKALGLEPDEVVVQSARARRHFELFLNARAEGRVYPCDCSRKALQADLAGHASAPHGSSPSYSGRCRDRSEVPSSGPNLGWRFRADDPSGRDDVLVARGTGDDLSAFAPSYHWACAIDDHDGRYRAIVRAWDLAEPGAHQRRIQAWLSVRRAPASVAVGREVVETPSGAPVAYQASLVVQDDGRRLEKRTKGVTLAELAASGVSAADVVRAFAASFDELAAASTVATSAAGASVGEPAREIKLSSLRISFP